MKDCLKAYLNKKISRSDFTIHYHIGNSFTGETDFRLKGDGNYELWSTVTKGRQKKSYSGRLNFEKIDQVVEGLLIAEVWKVKHFHDKPSQDDSEAYILIEVSNQPFKVTLWVSEILESPCFIKAQQVLLSLIHTLSGGEILETGQ